MDRRKMSLFAMSEESSGGRIGGRREEAIIQVAGSVSCVSICSRRINLLMSVLLQLTCSIPRHIGSYVCSKHFEFKRASPPHPHPLLLLSLCIKLHEPQYHINFLFIAL